MKVSKIAVSLIAATMAFSVSVTSLPESAFSNVISVSAATYLRKNSSGTQVTQMQKSLITLNYMKVGSDTGKFDQYTENAVKNIQSDYGLSTDGIAGPDTLGLINGLIDGTAKIIEVIGTNVNVRSGAGTNHSKVTVANKGQKYIYSSYKTVSGVKWYNIKIKNKSGYICGTYVSESAVKPTTPTSPTNNNTNSTVKPTTPSTSKPIDSGSTTIGKLVVKGDIVNVRSGAGTSYSKVTTVKRGQSYAYSNVKKVNGKNWYFITVSSSKKGWIIGDYVNTTPSNDNNTSQGGKITVKGDVVNVRSGAGTSYSKVTTVKRGQSYTYSEVKNGWYFIRINSSKSGWIIGDYVTATPNTTTPSSATTASSATTTSSTTASSATTTSSTAASSDTTTSSTVASSDTTTSSTVASTQPNNPVRQIITGTVKVDTKLNVRKGAGTSYTKLGTLKNGDKVVIVEKGKKWHKIEYGSGYGYVSADYIINIKTVNEPVSLKYSTAYYYINKGETVNVSLSASGATIAYSSSDSAKCPVSSKGIVTGKTEGLYEITAQCGSVSATTCVVVLREPYSGISAMKISQKGTKFIADWEGGGTVIETGETVFYPYQDVSGYWTIGYGHAKTSTASKSWSEERAISEFNKDIEAMIGAQYKLTDDMPYLTKDAATKLLNADLNDGSYVKAVSDWAIRNGVKLTQNQFDALASFCYNLGPSYWTSDSNKFYLKSAIISHRSGADASPDQIIEGFCRYIKSGGKNYKGLWYRRRNEAEMFLENDYAIDRTNKFTLPAGITWA